MKLSDFTKDMPSGRLVRRWNEMNSEERIIQLLHETLDVSDLLLAYPSLNAKQQAEQAIQFISKILENDDENFWDKLSEPSEIELHDCAELDLESKFLDRILSFLY